MPGARPRRRTTIGRDPALRREGLRNRSADVLNAAADVLAELCDYSWAAQAHVELERMAPGRSAAELTPTERRIAELVALGRRNRGLPASYSSVWRPSKHT